MQQILVDDGSDWILQTNRRYSTDAETCLLTNVVGISHSNWLINELANQFEIGSIRSADQHKVGCLSVSAAKDKRLHDLTQLTSDRIRRFLRGAGAMWQLDHLERQPRPVEGILHAFHAG